MANSQYRPLSEIDTESLPLHSSNSGKTRFKINNNYLVNVLIFSAGLGIGYLLNNQLYDRVATTSQHLIPSPAHDAIDGKPLVLSPHDDRSHHHHSNPFTGFPTPQKDAAWMELMDGYSVRVPSGTVEVLGLESIPLNDESGDVWVSLNVDHHLHCLHSIRHQVAGSGCKTPDHEVGEDYFPPHIDHCLETIRKRLMCQPDLGIRAMAWHPEIRVDAVNANNTVNAECVDWSLVKDWTKKHSFTREDRLITQPDGKIYPGPRVPPPRCGV